MPSQGRATARWRNFLHRLVMLSGMDSVTQQHAVLMILQAALRGMKPGDILHLYSTADAPPTLDATAYMRSALR